MNLLQKIMGSRYNCLFPINLNLLKQHILIAKLLPPVFRLLSSNVLVLFFDMEFIIWQYGSDNEIITGYTIDHIATYTYPPHS